MRIPDSKSKGSRDGLLSLCLVAGCGSLAVVFCSLWNHLSEDGVKLLLLWGQCFCMRKLLCLTRLERSFFSRSSSFKNTASVIVWGSKKIKEVHLLTACCNFFFSLFLTEWLWNPVLLKWQQGNFSVFLMRKKKQNILSDLWNALEAIPAQGFFG